MKVEKSESEKRKKVTRRQWASVLARHLGESDHSGRDAPPPFWMLDYSRLSLSCETYLNYLKVISPKPAFHILDFQNTVI